MLTVSRSSVPGAVDAVHVPGSTRTQLLEDAANWLLSAPVTSLVSTPSASATALQLYCHVMHEQVAISLWRHGTGVGTRVGDAMGDAVGDAVGATVGTSVGADVGVAKGAAVGDPVGTADGL